MAITRFSSSSPSPALKPGRGKNLPNVGGGVGGRLGSLVALKRTWEPFRYSEGPLVVGASWIICSLASQSPSFSESASSRGSVGRRHDVNYFGSENSNDTRRYLQHRNRIASSTSALPSSPLPGSSGIGVDAPYQDKEEDEEIEEEKNSSWLNFEKEKSSGLSDIASGSWEVEDDEDRVGEGGNGRNGFESITNSVDRENGSVDGSVDEDHTFSESSDVESITIRQTSSVASSTSTSGGASSTGSSKEPIYEVTQHGTTSKKHVSRRQLLRTSGLRLRDLRRVDPSLWVTNAAPALLVRDHAILLNLGSLRAIATTEEVLIFDRKSIGAQGFMRTLIPRLNDNFNQQTVMPFEHEVIESALITRTQRLEKSLMDVEPRVLTLLELLPTCMTADVLEDLRLCKQELVEVGSKAGALRQMLLEILEHPQDIRRIVVMGRVCKVSRDGSTVDCVIPQDRLDSEDEEEEMEMLLEYYLQRCESVHGQSLKLLSSAKEMEESIGVNLSSRRLEVNKLELLLQVGTFCAALGALVAGIFGMNLKSYLEERATAFYFTTGAIIFGGIALFFYMLNYLSKRKIL